MHTSYQVEFSKNSSNTMTLVVECVHEKSTPSRVMCNPDRRQYGHRGGENSDYSFVSKHAFAMILETGEQIEAALLRHYCNETIESEITVNGVKPQN